MNVSCRVVEYKLLGETVVSCRFRAKFNANKGEALARDETETGEGSESVG